MESGTAVHYIGRGSFSSAQRPRNGSRWAGCSAGARRGGLRDGNVSALPVRIDSAAVAVCRWQCPRRRRCCAVPKAAANHRGRPRRRPRRRRSCWGSAAAERGCSGRRKGEGGRRGARGDRRHPFRGGECRRLFVSGGTFGRYFECRFRFFEHPRQPQPLCRVPHDCGVPNARYRSFAERTPPPAKPLW